MNEQKEFPQNKTPEELEAQLQRVEKFRGISYPGAEMRQKILEMSPEEIRGISPQFYDEYVRDLRIIGGKDIDEISPPSAAEYNDEELGHIRSALSGEGVLGDSVKEKRRSDHNYTRYNMAGFFPGIYERVYLGGETPRMERLQAVTRGLAVSFEFEDGERRVIKRVENPREPVIAHIAEEEGVGPRQYETLPGFIHEEMLSGAPLNQLSHELATPEHMRNLGQEVTRAMRQLHARNIVINDQLLASDLGKTSHVYVEKDGSTRFVDFAAAVDVSNFPALDDDDVYTLLRTSIEGQFALAGATDETLHAILKDYRKTLQERYPDKEALMRGVDYRLLDEGLGFLSRQVPNTSAFIEGIKSILEK